MNQLNKVFFCVVLLIVPDVINAQSIARLKEGFIIDQYGAIYPGLLKINGEKVVFKEAGNDKRETLTVNDLKALQIEKDSFLVMNNYQLPFEDYKVNGFAKVMLRGTKDILCTIDIKREPALKGRGEPKPGAIDIPPFQGHAQPPTAKIAHYFIFRKGSFVFITDYNFHHEMPAVVSDYNELKNKIISKKLKFEDIELIASEYEKWKSKSGAGNR